MRGGGDFNSCVHDALTAGHHGVGSLHYESKMARLIHSCMKHLSTAIQDHRSRITLCCLQHFPAVTESSLTINPQQSGLLLSCHKMQTYTAQVHDNSNKNNSDNIIDTCNRKKKKIILRIMIVETKKKVVDHDNINEI